MREKEEKSEREQQIAREMGGEKKANERERDRDRETERKRERETESVGVRKFQSIRKCYAVTENKMENTPT